MKKLFWLSLIVSMLFLNHAKAQVCSGGCLQGASINLTLQNTAAKKGIGYSGILIATGGHPPYSFTKTSGTLPAGTTLATCSAVLSCSVNGTPTTATSYSFTIQVTDSSSVSQSFPFSLSVASLSSTAVTSANGYSLSVGGTTQATCTGTWSDTTTNNLTVLSGTTWASSVTANVTVSSTGLVTGVASGSSNITCAFAAVTSPTVAFTTATGTVVISTTTLANGQINQSYPESPNPTQQLMATGGTAPYTFALSSGSLPAGITLNTSTGALTGTATASGSFSPHFTATDSASHTSAAVTLSLTIASLSSVSVDCKATPGCRAMNQGASLQFYATGTYSDSSTADVTNQVTGGGSSPISAFTTAIGSDYTGVAQSSLTTAAFNAVVGKVAVLKCKAGLNSNNFTTPTDTAGNTWTLQGTVTSFSGGSKMGIWTAPITVANASDTAACNYSATAAFLSDIVGEYSNVAASSFVDGTSTILANASSNTIATTGIASSNASDMVILFADTNATARVFSCPASYTVEVTTTDGDSALCDLFVSSTNTYAPQATFSGAAHLNAGGLILLKAAGTSTPWSETDVTGTGVASVSAGLVNALNGSSIPNSATITACVGATCGSVTITVTSGAITSLTISPMLATIQIGKTQTYKCLDQNMNNVTSAATFASDTPSVASNTGSGVGAATFIGNAQGTAHISCKH